MHNMARVWTRSASPRDDTRTGDGGGHRRETDGRNAWGATGVAAVHTHWQRRYRICPTVMVSQVVSHAHGIGQHAAARGGIDDL